MTSLGLKRLLLALAAALVLPTAAAPAFAQTEAQCEQQATDAGDVCIPDDNGGFQLLHDDSGFDGGGDGIPGFFVFFVILVVVIGIGTTIWKVSTARRLAAEAGMDPDVAAGMTLLTDDGLGATYIAANLRNNQPSAPAPDPKPSVADRLSNLKLLLDGGAITQDEYDRRRQAIIDSV